VVQILLFHVFLAPDPQGMVVALVLVVCEAYLGFVVYRKSFRPLLSPNPV
jgi:hypothetical protein